MQLAPSPPERVDVHIRTAYRRYVTEVSHPAHAVSLQLAFFLWRLADARRPAQVLDLGSGFSSFVFRLFAATTDDSPVVWSVDDNGDWLGNTQNFLAEMGVGTDNLTTWDSFEGGEFDLVLHDLGSMTTRETTLEAAFDLVVPSGVLVVDDLHFPAYRTAVESLAECRGATFIDGRADTEDLFGRYSGLVFP